ncbi:hypothetical protein NC651_025451 [Populus alba x Populus x berolinensis]|nr:hypothetical protein NC651_025451 [Populus alba x Populus x berolinensis]
MRTWKMFCNRNKKESKSCILIESNEEIYMLIKIKLRLGSGESLSNTGDLLGINQSFLSQITRRSVEAMEERVDRSNGVWIDREKNHNMLLQATVDPNMRFRGVIVGFPGSLSDELLLQNSSFHKLSKEVKMLNEKKIELQEGVESGKYKSGALVFPYCHGFLLLIKMHSGGLHNIVIDMEDKVFYELPSSHQHDTDYRQQICETASKTGIVMRENFLSTFLENHHLQHSLPRSRDVVTDSFEQKFGPPNEDNTDVVQE